MRVLPFHATLTIAKVVGTPFILEEILMTIAVLVLMVGTHDRTIIAGRGIQISFVRHVNVTATLHQIAIC